MLINHCDIDFNCQNHLGHSAFFQAVISANVEAFKLIYDTAEKYNTQKKTKEINFNQLDNNRSNALMLAAHKGEKEIFKFLLAKDSNQLSAKDEDNIVYQYLNEAIYSFKLIKNIMKINRQEFRLKWQVLKSKKKVSSCLKNL